MRGHLQPHKSQEHKPSFLSITSSTFELWTSVSFLAILSRTILKVENKTWNFGSGNQDLGNVRLSIGKIKRGCSYIIVGRPGLSVHGIHILPEA